MSKTDVIRAWKDPEYRSTLSEQQLAALPANPAGPMELREDDLEMVAGGDTYFSCYSDCPLCNTFTGSCWTDNTSSCQFSC